MAHVVEKATMKLIAVGVGIPVAKATKKLVEGAQS